MSSSKCKFSPFSSWWWSVRASRSLTHCQPICHSVNYTIRLTNQPRALASPDKATKAHIIAARQVLKKKHYTFHLNEAVEIAPIVQVVSAVEPQDLIAVCNRHTGHCGSNVLTVLQHLFTMYGHITPQQLNTRELEICNMHFHMALPVDAIFNAIDELIELAEYALMPTTSSQAVSIAYVVFSKTPSYCRTSGLGIIAQLSIAHGRT